MMCSSPCCPSYRKYFLELGNNNSVWCEISGISNWFLLGQDMVGDVNIGVVETDDREGTEEVGDRIVEKSETSLCNCEVYVVSSSTACRIMRLNNI